MIVLLPNLNCRSVSAAFVCWLLCSTLVIANASANEAIVEIEDAQVTTLSEAIVAAPESGRVRELIVQAGDQIEDQAALVQMDDQKIRMEAEAQAFELKKAELLVNDDIDIRYTQRALDFAKVDLQRSLDLNNDGAKAIADSEIEKQQLQTEKLALAAERAEIELKTNRFNYELKRRQLEILLKRLNDLRVLAPISGTVAETMVKPGEWVRSGEPLCRVIHLERLRVEAFLDGSRFDQRSLQGAAVRFTTGLPPNQEPYVFHGTLTFVSPEVNPVNGEIRVWAEIDNSELLLRPGCRGRLTVVSERTARR